MTAETIPENREVVLPSPYFPIKNQRGSDGQETGAHPALHKTTRDPAVKSVSVRT
jgi:hypothetical protein